MNNKAYAKFGGQTRYECADGEVLMPRNNSQ